MTPTAPRPYLWLLALLAACSWLGTWQAAYAGTIFDPQLAWQTLETPHFHIHYERRHETIAQRAAVFAEEAYGEVTGFLHRPISGQTELTLLDNEDTVNGVSLPYPNRMIYVYLTGPDQDMLVGRYESALKWVITHEFTHAVQFEATGGWVSLINQIFGRALYPNLLQPFFLVEGLAVTAESRFTRGGRAREGDFDMIVRCAALEDKLLDIDQAGGYYLTLWPGGSSTYIYGTYFYQFLIARYGSEIPGRISTAYGTEPWLGINRAFERVLPGHSTYEIWGEFEDYLKMRSRRQLARIQQHPLIQGEAVTHDGYYHRHPVWGPDGLMYVVAGPQRSSSLVRDPLNGQAAQRLLSKSPFGSYSLADRFLYCSGAHEVDAYRTYDDLYRYDTRTHAVVQLTDGKRASDPAVSPDGQRVIASLNDAGTSNLALFDAGGSYLQALTHHTDGTQYSGTAWSPDGKTAVTSRWHDGSRDLALFEPGKTEPAPLWRDSAIDVDPAWSPDGKLIYFSSDRDGGVFNLFAYRLADRKLFQLTNVVGAAVEPAPSPDGKQLAFSSYSAAGWDIRTLTLDPASWREVALAEATVYDPLSGDPVPAPSPPDHEALPQPAVPYPSHPYHPWDTLSPKTWSPVAYVDEKSYMLGITTFGQDVLMQHYAYLNAGWSLGGNRPYYVLSYTNDQLPPTLSLNLSDVPTSYTLSHRNPNGTLAAYDLWQHQVGGSLSATFPGVPSKLLGTSWVQGQSITLGASALNVSYLGARPSGGGDLGQVPGDLVGARGAPPEGPRRTVFARYQFADNYRSGYAISPESGQVLGIDYEKALPVAGGGTTYDRVSADFRRYQELPWRHHVLAVRAAGGVNVGRPDGDFYLGGAGSSNLVTIMDERYIAGVDSGALRGYSTGQLSGDRMALASLEYRFPLWEIQRGPGTLPLFFRRLSGAVFTDAGWIGRGSLPNDPRFGFGVEARTTMDVINVPTELRLGFAQGTHPQEGGPHFILEAGISF